MNRDCCLMKLEGSFSVEASVVMGLILILLAGGILLFLDVFAESIAGVSAADLPDIAEAAERFRFLRLFAR